MIKKYIPILLFALCMAAGSCTQQRQPCAEPVLVSLRFSVLSTHTVIDSTVLPPTSIRVAFDTLLPNALLGSLDGLQNQVYSYNGLFTAQFSLLLNPNADSCRWYISQDSGRTVIDTITFHYTRQLQFLSNACGYTYYYTLTTIPTTPNLNINDQIRNPFDTTYHRIDSIKIENANVTNDVNLEHLQIFIHNPH